MVLDKLEEIRIRIEFWQATVKANPEYIEAGILPDAEEMLNKILEVVYK